MGELLNFNITHHSLNLYGVCGSCQKEIGFGIVRKQPKELEDGPAGNKCSIAPFHPAKVKCNTRSLESATRNALFKATTGQLTARPPPTGAITRNNPLKTNVVDLANVHTLRIWGAPTLNFIEC